MTPARMNAAPQQPQRYANGIGKAWVARNATELTWTGLIVAGVLLSTLFA